MDLIESFRRRPVLWSLAAVAIVLVLIATVVFAVRLAPVQVDSVRLDRTELAFSSLTESYRLTAETEPAGIEAKRLSWSTSNATVATVSDDGVVTPVGEGEAVITVRGDRGAGVATCAVTVYSVSGLTLNQHNIVLNVGKSHHLLYTVSPQGATVSDLIWASSDPSVVSVDQSGVLTAHKTGAARISVALSDGSFSDSCEVLVTENVPVEGVTFDITEFTFDDLKDVLVLTPVFTPVNTSQRTLEWMSSDESVATVNPESGEVTAISNGTATIIAKSSYGEYAAACQVTVNLNVPLKGISLSTNTYTFTGLGQIYLISPIFEPFNASNRSITWKSSNPSVATVSDSGVVTSVKKGSATISLVTQDGGFKAEFKVIVDPSTHVSVTGVKLSSYSASIKEGETVQISASVLPSNATEKRVKYTSKNPSVATVSSSGLVTAVGQGTTQIVVSSVDGNYSENFTVTVSAPQVVVPPAEVETEYVKGVWVATVANINFPSKKGLSADALKAEIDTIMDNVVQMGLNTVYFQVRPCGDALYPSQYYPSSSYVVKNQGDALPTDILAYAIESAHSRGLELHAWINPYRVTHTTTSTSGLAASNPAIQHPEWVVSNGTKLYLNPGLPEVRQYIIDGVMEIVRNYDVDGIHFDDYFYPSELGSWNDDDAYNKYGNGMTRADWRRSNNDALIRGVHEAIEAHDSSVSFGVSPAAVWAMSSHVSGGVDIPGGAYETYSQAYADTKKWVENEWLDYICPQVYFQMNHSKAPFKPIVDWWNALVADTDVRLYIGIAAYKCGGSDSVADFAGGAEIPAQLDYLDSCAHVDGAVFYNYDSLMSNYAGVRDVVRNRYYKEPVSLTLQFSQPSMTLDSSFKSTYIVGVSDPNYPLYADGVLVKRTSDGYFAHSVTLSGTTTVVRFTHKGQVEDYVITRTGSGSGGNSDEMSAFGFVQGSFTPSYDTADLSGTKITFSCVAPAGSTVTVKIGAYTVSLTTSTKDPGDRYRKATYKGTFTLPQIDGGGNASLGYVVFHAERNGESATHSPGSLIEVINDPSVYAMEVKNDKVDLRPSLDSSVKPTSYYIATAGSKVNVISKADGWVKLTNGMYLSVNDVEPLKSSFGLAEVRSVSLGVLTKHTVLSFKMTESVFHTVWMNPNQVEIVLYNVTGEVPSFSLGNNPLFSSVQIDRLDDTTVSIKLTYKAEKHIYGYTCNFDGNTLYINFRNPAVLSSVADKPLTGIVISIDPGHSNDSGAVRYYNGVLIQETDLNLKLSKLVAEKLRNLGATVVLSHEGERVYDLDEIITQFRSLSPDINVSIHFNTVENDSQSVSGTETYWCYGNSQLLSDVMLKSFTDAMSFTARKSACDYYKVSRFCEFPSILFETAYMSNVKDLAWFLDDSNMDTAAGAIANGILDYFKEQNN